jgi:hypothetical protein
MSKKIFIPLILITPLSFLECAFKFKLGETPKEEVTEIIKEKEIIKINPQTNILKIIDKEKLNNKIQKSEFKIINLEKYNKILNNKKESIKLGVSIKNNFKTTISKLEYNLTGRQWYVLRKEGNILKFIAYTPLNQKDFYNFSTYIKFEKGTIKILRKVKEEFVSSIIKDTNKITFKELSGENFEITTYTLNILKRSE